jgi:hypothetical protein
MSDRLEFWFLYLTIPLGILLNMFSIYIFSRPNLNKNANMGFFYLNLSIYNTLVLIYYFFIMDSKLVFGVNLTTKSNVSCKIITFIRRCIREIPTWIEALITFDRYLAICHSNKYKFMKSKKNIFIIITIIILSLGLISVSNFYYFILIDSNNINGTMITNEKQQQVCQSTKFNQFFSDIISVLFRTFIPGILMSIFSLKLINKVKQVKLKSNSYNEKDRTFNNTILFMNLIFFILNLPVSIMYIIKNVYDNNLSNQQSSSSSSSSIEIRAYISIFYLFSYHIANLHYSTMFFQFLLFNKLFKIEFFSIFKLNSSVRKYQTSNNNVNSVTVGLATII